MNSSEASTQTDSTRISAGLRGETMAYAVQNAAYNLGANFFEPYINQRVQARYARRDPTHIGAGNYTQNLAGEFAGDVIGASALILAEALCPEPLHHCSRTVRRLIDPLYTSAAEWIFAKEKGTPGYEQKVEKWKTIQERNLVRSGIIATAGLAGNIATQKLLIGNTAPTKVLFAGKLASTALTTMIGLTARLAFPDQTKGLDRWIGKNIFAPMLQDKEIDAASDSQVERLNRREAQAQERSDSSPRR